MFLSGLESSQHMVPSILRFYQIMNAEHLPTQDQSVVKKKKNKIKFFLADEKHENKNHSEATVMMKWVALHFSIVILKCN